MFCIYIFCDEDIDQPAVFVDRLNDFLEMIGKPKVNSLRFYKNI